MKPTAFRYEVHIRIELTRSELDLLIDLCDKHYDSAVRGLAEPGKSAALNNVRNHMNYPPSTSWKPDDTAEGLFTYRQLDALAKALEGADSVAGLNLAVTVKKLMTLVTEERRRVDQNELAAPLLFIP